MGDRLTEGAVGRGVVGGRRAVDGLLGCGDTGDSAKTRGHIVNVRLRDIGLQQEGKNSREHDEAGRGPGAPNSRISRCDSRHQTRNRQNSNSLCSIRRPAAIGRTWGSRVLEGND